MPQPVADLPNQTPAPRLFRRHNCTRSHRTYHTLAQCIWPRAAWITGEGPYATLADCRHGPSNRPVLTVQLHATLAGARNAKAMIDSTGCGGRCPATGSGHHLIEIIAPNKAEPW